MAQIKNATFNDGTWLVEYESGTERKYPEVKLPMTVKKWLEENIIKDDELDDVQNDMQNDTQNNTPNDTLNEEIVSDKSKQKSTENEKEESIKPKTKEVIEDDKMISLSKIPIEKIISNMTNFGIALLGVIFIILSDLIKTILPVIATTSIVLLECLIEFFTELPCWIKNSVVPNMIYIVKETIKTISIL